MSLNCKNSSWKENTSGVPQESILGPLLFLIYKSDLSDGLSSNCELFADDTSVFSVVHDVTIGSFELNSDLAKISEWDFKWKMIFNPDPTKSAQELIFSRKLKTVPHPLITFNNNPLSLCSAQNHLGLVLDSKLTFNDPIKHILSKVNKSIGLLSKSQLVLPISFQDYHSLLFIRHLSEVISTTLMLFMTKITSRRFTKNLSRFNTMLLW